ncbi:unnamed protein product [Amoebophrya sp. A120]|nr:unnamed protein product [Amoebophrya sp. A120]|eukprot:GSA120T00001345001.1
MPRRSFFFKENLLALTSFLATTSATASAHGHQLQTSKAAAKSGNTATASGGGDENDVTASDIPSSKSVALELDTAGASSPYSRGSKPAFALGEEEDGASPAGRDPEADFLERTHSSAQASTRRAATRNRQESSRRMRANPSKPRNKCDRNPPHPCCEYKSKHESDFAHLAVDALFVPDGNLSRWTCVEKGHAGQECNNLREDFCADDDDQEHEDVDSADAISSSGSARSSSSGSSSGSGSSSSSGGRFSRFRQWWREDDHEQ